MFYDPLCKLTGASASLQSSFAGIERVLEVLDQDAAIRDLPGARPLPVQPRTLGLEHVRFAYGRNPVLKDVTVSIPPGQMVAFVGPSGAGKSTLLNLLPRFYDPSQGRVLLDEHDVRSVLLSELRRHVAVVLQEGLLLPTTISENIAYSAAEASPQEIREAAAAAGADAFIESLPDGYETVLRQGGSNLSGGQRQRIAIARALLSQAPILVLDEPTSALDAENERLLTETLNRLKGERTMVLVSHRLSTVAGCDRIYVLQDGEIVQAGTHEQLLHQDGLYAEMWRHQMQLDVIPISAAA
jgi:subfamily B ATP-binding cassette protein MsbA